MVGHGNDHGVELVCVLGKGFAVILAGESVGVVLGRFREVDGVDITESDDLRIGMAGDLGAVCFSDRPDDADGEHAEFAIAACSVGAG